MIGVHRGRAASRLIFDFRVGVQVAAAVDNFNMLETGIKQAAEILVNANGAGDAANISGDAVGDGLGEIVLESDIADGETSAGLEDARDFAKDSGLVGREIENAIGDDAVDGGIGQRNFVDGGEMEVDIGIAAGGCVGARAIDHGGRHIDADGATGGADHVGGEEDIEAAAGAEVDHHLARFEMRGCGGIAAGEAHVGGRGDGGELLGGVAEGFRNGLDTRMIAGERAFRDGGVFRLD